MNAFRIRYRCFVTLILSVSTMYLLDFEISFCQVHVRVNWHCNCELLQPTDGSVW